MKGRIGVAARRGRQCGQSLCRSLEVAGAREGVRPGTERSGLLCILHGPGLSGTTGAHPGSLPAPFRADNRCSAQLGTRPCVRPGRHTGDRTLETDSATNSRHRGKMEKASDIYTKVLVPALNGANIRDRIQMEVRWGVGQRGGGCLGTQDIRPKLRSEG